MKYYEDTSIKGDGPNGGTVYAYDETTQEAQISLAAIKGWKDVSSQWPPALTLVGARTSKIQELQSACATAIVSGFSSSALGAAHTYPSKPEDQTNLIGAVTAGVAVKFWCADASGAWSFASHTAAQIKQVLADGVAAREALSAKLASLTATVDAAATIADVQAISW